MLCLLRWPIVAGLAGLLSLSAPLNAASQDAATFEALRAADMRLAGIGWRLASANAALCDQREPGTGLQLHTLDQFGAAERDAARQHFGFESAVAVEGVVAGSPAERAGLKPDDSLVRLGSVVIDALPGAPGTTDRLVAAQLAIAALPPESAIEVEVMRKGARVRVTLQPVAACKTRFELKLGDAYSAAADGTMVQIGEPIVLNYTDEQIAAVVAHEFSHNILRHRDRLRARGVDFGMLSGFGANVKYFRQSELQADLLGVYLLANAGYPPSAAPSFWQRFGPSKAGGIFRSRSHPHWRDRVATIEAELARIAPISTRPIVPAILAERDKPLTGDWQSLLVRK